MNWARTTRNNAVIEIEGKQGLGHLAEIELEEVGGNVEVVDVVKGDLLATVVLILVVLYNGGTSRDAEESFELHRLLLEELDAVQHQAGNKAVPVRLPRHHFSQVHAKHLLVAGVHALPI